VLRAYLQALTYFWHRLTLCGYQNGASSAQGLALRETADRRGRTEQPWGRGQTGPFRGRPVSSAVAEEARDGDFHQDNVQGNLEHVQHGYYLLSLDKATSKNRVAAI
jgi:hypothetical protein